MRASHLETSTARIMQLNEDMLAEFFLDEMNLYLPPDKKNHNVQNHFFLLVFDTFKKNYLT